MSSPVPAPEPPRYASTADVARALGVSVTTVKRWVDDGILPARRTAGGHRKLCLADVARAVRDGNLPAADVVAAVRETDPSAFLRRMLAAADAVDAEMVRGVILAAHAAGLRVETIADAVVAPALAHVGHRWESGEAGVADEHHVTQGCIAAGYELAGRLRPADHAGRPVALGGAPEGDHYVLPSLLAKLTLLENGWAAVNLGPHTPMAAIRDELTKMSPRLVWVSVSHLTDVEAFVAEFAEMSAAAVACGAAVAVGGRGLTDAVRARLPYTTFGDGLTHLAAFARTLHPPRQRPKRGRPPAAA